MIIPNRLAHITLATPPYSFPLGTASHRTGRHLGKRRRWRPCRAKRQYRGDIVSRHTLSTSLEPASNLIDQASIRSLLQGFTNPKANGGHTSFTAGNKTSSHKSFNHINAVAPRKSHSEGRIRFRTLLPASEGALVEPSPVSSLLEAVATNERLHVVPPLSSHAASIVAGQQQPQGVEPRNY